MSEIVNLIAENFVVGEEHSEAREVYDTRLSLTHEQEEDDLPKRAPSSPFQMKISLTWSHLPRMLWS